MQLVLQSVWWKCLCVEALCFRLPVCPPAFSTASECKAVCESSCTGECLHLSEWRSESPFCALESFVQTSEALRRSPSVCLRVCPVFFSPLQFFIFLGQFHLGSKIVLSSGSALTAWRNTGTSSRSDQPHFRHNLLLIAHPSAAICWVKYM